MRSTILLAILLSGCASQPPQSWHKPSARSGDEMVKDYRECGSQAQIATVSDTSPLRQGYNARRVKESCLYSRGWVKR